MNLAWSIIACVALTAEPGIITNYAGLTAGEVGFDETQMAIYYPDGVGPISAGYASDPRGVIIILRGGNTNMPPSPEPSIEMAQMTIDAGYISVVPNYAIIDEGEDYTIATDSLAKAMQFLRSSSTELNITPEDIVIIGRSHGGVQALALALKDDYQQASGTPQEQESTRPLAVAVMSSPTHLGCFNFDHPGTQTITELLIPGYDPGVTDLRMPLLHSPVFWLVNPQRYDREITPPIALLYKYEASTAECGTVSDPHDGYFAQPMARAMKAYATYMQDPDYLSGCLFQDTSQGIDYESLIAWSIERLESN